MSWRRALAAALVLGFLTPASLAQQPLRRFEIGTQTTMLRALGQNRPFCAACPVRYWSAGPAVTFHVNRTFAVDTAFTLFSGPGTNPSWLVGGNVAQMLAGLRASVHGSRLSLFAKARPGFVRWSRGRIANIVFTTPGTTLPNGIFDPGPYFFTYAARTNPVLDLGGGVEYAINNRLAVRAEMGDTLMWWRYAQSTFDRRPRGLPSFFNNLQISSGVFYRMGGILPTEALSSPASTHRFVDRMNMTLWGASLLAQTADAVTTQRRQANCRKLNPRPDDPLVGCGLWEANPLARPFVVHGWGGQIAAGAVLNSAQLSVAYVLHKMGHHRVERFVSAPVTVVSGVSAYKNLQ